jgi:hypothetical protein
MSARIKWAASVLHGHLGAAKDLTFAVALLKSREPSGELKAPLGATCL